MMQDNIRGYAVMVLAVLIAVAAIFVIIEVALFVSGHWVTGLAVPAVLAILYLIYRVGNAIHRY